MPLAIFDLDNTLLAGDSDYLWGIFLAEQGLVDKDLYNKENERFYREYEQGELDIYEFLQFSLRPLKENSLKVLHLLRKQFLKEHILPIITRASKALIESHRSSGDTLMIITATNAFVTAPIAELLGIDHLIATDPEMIDGAYTGEVAGEPSFQQGKVSRLNLWLKEHSISLEGSSFYSDSHNDIPLLEQVTKPVAVDPDPQLAQYATKLGWPIISLRD
ncbi:MAG: HAD family hydrolase [Gammaproteobacteria bacterium]|nr:HAD family hydrolase [Gammaproteobacteria bacterium]